MAAISRKDIFKLTVIPVVVASLCCLAPVILVTFGLSTLAFAAALGDVLYGEYDWLFRIVGLGLLGISVYFYITRQRGICTLDQVRRRRNEVTNIIMIALIVGVVGYIVFLYGIVELWGLAVGLWRPDTPRY